MLFYVFRCNNKQHSFLITKAVSEDQTQKHFDSEIPTSTSSILHVSIIG